MENRITKESLIKSVAKQTGNTVGAIKEVYNALEEIIFNTLSSVDEDNNVSIKLFEGISIDGVYVPEKVKKNNLTGEKKLVESKIKPKCNITRSYCEKLNLN